MDAKNLATPEFINRENAKQSGCDGWIFQDCAEWDFAPAGGQRSQLKVPF